MKTSDKGRELIEGFEGLFLEAYDDATNQVVKPHQLAVGTLTIGYGHTTKAGPPRVYVGMGIDKADADAILASDLAAVEIEVEHLVKVALNQNQFDALVSFQFNTGWLAHPHCSLLGVLNAGLFKVADQDFMLYDRAAGKVLVGLDNRRRAEMRLFATPV